MRRSLSNHPEAYSVTGVAGGLLDDEGRAALLAFDAEAGRFNLLLPVAELMALLSVCLGLAGQNLPESGDAEHPTIPVADWRVGVTATQEVVVGLAPEAGGALAFHLNREQARALAAALTQALEIADSARH